MKFYSICSCVLSSFIIQGIFSSNFEIHGHEFPLAEKMEANQTLRPAIQSAIETNNAEVLSRLLADPKATTILNRKALTGVKEGADISDFLLESIQTNKSPALISTLLQSAIQSNSMTETLPYLLQKIQASASPNISNVLTSTLTDPTFLTSMLEKNGELPEQTKSNYLTLLDQAIKEAPLFVRVGYPALKGAVKIFTNSIKKMNETLKTIKNGQYKTSHNQNNAAHLSILECNSTALSWCIMNCQRSIFSQKNAQGSTPLEFAKIKKNLLEASQQKILQQIEILKPSGKRRIISFKAIQRKKLRKKLLKNEKQLSECSCIIQMLESITETEATGSATLEMAPIPPAPRLEATKPALPEIACPAPGLEAIGSATLEMAYVSLATRLEATELDRPEIVSLATRLEATELDRPEEVLPLKFHSAKMESSGSATFEKKPVLSMHYSSVSEESAEDDDRILSQSQRAYSFSQSN